MLSAGIEQCLWNLFLPAALHAVTLFCCDMVYDVV